MFQINFILLTIMLILCIECMYLEITKSINDHRNSLNLEEIM